MSQINIVVGSPRSGTTVVAGILHLCGVPMFPSLDKAIYGNAGDEWNQGGHYSDLDFHLLILRHLRPLDLWATDWPPDSVVTAEIEAFVAARSAAPKWGAKGMDAWRGAKVLAALGHDVRVIQTQRELLQSQASFEARTGPAHKSIAAALVAEIEADSRRFYDEFQGPKLAVSFDAIFGDTQATVESIAAFAGVAATPEAVAWVDPQQRRFR